MRAEKDIDVAGRKVTVYELTVADVRERLKALMHGKDAGEAADAETQAVRVALFEDITLDDIVAMTSLEDADLDDMTPSDLRKVADVCREVNSHFFAMRERLVEIGRGAQSGS